MDHYTGVTQTTNVVYVPLSWQFYMDETTTQLHNGQLQKMSLTSFKSSY